MGISHELFHPWSETAQQGRHRPAAGGGHCSDPAAVAGRHGHSGNGEKQSEAVQQSPAAGTAAILAPLPMQGDTGASAADSAGGTAGEGSGAADASAVTLEQFEPRRQAAGAYQVKAYDSSVIRQPSCGQVDLSYFSDAALLGDSLTVGFSDYSINLGGALICGYTGVGPDAIVNRSAVKSSVRGSEVAMDVLTAAQPKKLYILLGTNTLTTLGAADRFLAYYGQMLDQLRQALPGCVIYVQSIPPVRPQAAAEKPGLASDVLRSVNEQLAKLAADKGCVYLDLWETFADENGNLKEMLAAPDGVHFSAGNGYGAWVTYLRNHESIRLPTPGLWAAHTALNKERNAKTASQTDRFAMPFFMLIGKERLTSACSWPSCAARGSGSACGCADSQG